MKTDRTIWNASVSHPLQSWEWGEFRKAMGIDVVRMNNWQLTFHKIPHTPWTIGYFPKGPIPTQEMVKKLTKLGKEKHAIYIQLEPNSNVSDAALPHSLVSSHRPMFTKHTFIIDCTKTEEELLSAMHSKTRYNINLAKKRGVSIQEDNSDAAYSAYERLSDETTTRQGFYAHNHAYHRTAWKMLHSAGMARIFTATYENKTLAAWMLFVWNKRVYYPYGASSRENREAMAPTLLLWEIVRWAKKEGYDSFDLWGALGSNPDPNDPWYGFHKFKQGYNPTLVTYIGSFDLIIRPFLYRVFTILDSIRWLILKKSR